MNILILLSIAVILVFLILGLLYVRNRNRLGSLTGKRVYSDTDDSPGKVLIAKTLNLSGKPDYILKQESTYVPVEVKTGRTPQRPYQNHEMQLMAYCLLIEENFDVRVPGGIIRYPEKEFKIRYTPEAKDSVKKLVAEITAAKIANLEPTCTHPNHNK